MLLGHHIIRGVCSLKSPGDLLVEVRASQFDFLLEAYGELGEL